MPITYDYSARSYQVSCSICGTAAHTDSPNHSDAIRTDVEGQLVSDTFAWDRSGGRFYSWCRPCTRARARARRAAGTPRRASATMSTGTARGIDRNFGVELELIFPAHVNRSQIQSAIMVGSSDWRVKTDGSLSGNGAGNGWEVVSPVLSGEDGMEQIKRVCEAVRALGATVNRTCGLHVHHDVREMTVENIKTAASSWYNARPIVDGLVAPSRREGGSYYCKPLVQNDITRINRVTTLAEMRRISLDRYRTFNLMSYGRYGTIEIRQHQGTFNYEKIRTWILMGQAFMDAAVTGVAPQTSSVRNFVSSLRNLLDETAATFTLGRALEFNYSVV